MVEAGTVRLLPGSPFYDRQELHRQGVLGSIDPDRLLFDYRNLANLPQPAGVWGGMGGWDGSFIKGHMIGHYISAASRMAVATDDWSFETKVNYIVSELADCQDALGEGGYLAAFPSVALDWLEGTSSDNGGVVVPYYTIHKILAALLDAYHYLGNNQAFEVAVKLADYIHARLTALPDNTLDAIFRTDGSGNPQNEFGAMSDSLTLLYQMTGDQKYLDTAAMFNRSWYIVPLAAGEDRLAGLHANTHIAEALGIANTAVESGYLEGIEASMNFWDLMTHHHSFVTGGNSFHEWLDASGVETGPSIDGGKTLPDTTGETCNSHNMLKLTAILFEREPPMAYVDRCDLEFKDSFANLPLLPNQHVALVGLGVEIEEICGG